MYNLLTVEWFLYKALVGIGIGFFCRMLEHWAWERNEKRISPHGDLLLFGIRVFTQSICVGLPLAYFLLIIIAAYVHSETVITISAYLSCALMSYIAVDVRELIRRITNVSRM
jgi:hypothetical protein